MRSLIILPIVIVAVFGQGEGIPPPTATPESIVDGDGGNYLVKNDTAAGHRHHRHRHNDDDYYGGGYGGYGGGYGGYGGSYGGYGWQPAPPLEDNNVCDFDASVLLVVGHRRDGRRNNARRVRCAEIANQDDDSCNVCCQQAARRDPSIQNSEMFGFLAVTDKNRHDKSDEHRRNKRNADSDEDKKDNEVAENIFYPDPQYTNVKCMCCAPIRGLPQFSAGGYGQQSGQAATAPYGQAVAQPVYGGSSYQTAAATPYQPSVEPPTPVQPIYNPPTPVQPIQPVSNYQAPVPVQNYQGPSPVQNYQGPAPVQNYQAPTPVQNYQAPAPVQNYQAPAPVQNYQAPTPVQSSYNPPTPVQPIVPSY